MKTTARVMAFLILSCFLLSVFSPGAARAITIKQEEEIAREFMTYVNRHYPIIRDPQVNYYVNKLGNEILSHFPTQPLKYTFYVVKSDVYNAFAGPGGHIFVHSGLIEALKSEEELAGIIGHEISHVYCRHISDRIERSKKIGIGTLAGIAAGIFLGINGDPAVGSALTIGSLAGSQSVSLAYGREDEIQADRLGLKYLVESGYGGSGLMDSLKVIRDKQWFGPEEIPTYLTTHPALGDRMVYIKNWLENNQSLVDKYRKVRVGYAFDQIRTRIRALYGDGEKVLTEYKAQVEKSPDDWMANYGYGLSLSRSGKYRQAAEYLKKIIETNAFDVNYLKDLGEVYFKDGKFSEALDVFQGALSLNANDYENNIFVARIYMEQGRHEEAASLFHALDSAKQGNNQLNYYFGNVNARLGKMYESHYYLGVYYKNRLNYTNALFHLKKALEKPGGNERKEEIEAMIKNVHKGKLKAGNEK